MKAPVLDVITIGRSSVDLYGQQIGGRLWAKAAEAWLAGLVTDREASEMMSGNFAALCAAWDWRNA